VKPDELPLVSIVTPTHDRPEDLQGILACLAAQTYANIEAIVVNHGAAPVGEVVAQFPFARSIDVPADAGALRAAELGRREARGEYIGTLHDDDRLYPDHIERLVTGMLRSGAKIAHGARILRYLERDADDHWRTIGFNNRTSVSSELAGPATLVHRSVYETATQHYFAAFSDRVTVELRDRAGERGVAATITIARP